MKLASRGTWFFVATAVAAVGCGAPGASPGADAGVGQDGASTPDGATDARHVDASTADVGSRDGSSKDAGGQDVGGGDGGTGDAAMASGFDPAPGFGVTGTLSDGDSITISSSAGVFGTKPHASAPLLWAPMDTGLAPSSLGRVSSWGAPSGGLAWAATCGPTGQGCATGSGSASTGVAPGVNAWTLGFDVDQWSGNTYGIDSYGQKTYVYRQTWRNFGHLAESANYNAKTIRYWGRTGGVGSAQAYPDMYIPSNNGRFTVEGLTKDWTPSPDYNIDPSLIAQIENNENAWYSEEILTVSNSNASATDANINWMVPGVNGGETIVNFPNTTYQVNAWKFRNAASTTEMKRIYPCHYIVDGSAGSGRLVAPAGSYVQYATVYVDDSWARAVVQDATTYTSAKIREIQVVTSWSAASVTIALRKGMLGSLSGQALFVVDNDNTPHFIGTFK